MSVASAGSLLLLALLAASPASAAPINSHADAGTDIPANEIRPTAPTSKTAAGGPRATAPSPQPIAPLGPNPLWNAVLPALAALGGALVGYLSTRASSRAGIIQKTNELEIESLDRRLSEFVGPFMQLSEENRILALEIKRSQPVPEDFRTLTGLLTSGWREGLSKGEVTLLDAIVRNGVDLRRLLMDKGSAMVSPALIPLFSRATTHFRLLELAYAGSLDADPARYSAYVYPRELDGVVEAERLRLERRRELLRSHPHRSHPRMADLVVEPEATDGDT